MSQLVRFGVALEKNVLKEFDQLIRRRHYPTRSKAIGDLIRAELVNQQWESDILVTGVIALVYDHHRRDLVNHLVDVQHQFHPRIISSQHVHLDHHHCLEIIVAKGRAREVEELANLLQSVKGVKFGYLVRATTGKQL
ncbi:MAG: nickel-responsive transcriptional regulator NikR [Candidatus Omnitrophica bacterium]|nr:nickel-responsive transcriptional regulator NikR [Candidatus Omnitrophota bacterium]